MSIGMLALYIGIIALVLTAITAVFRKEKNNLWMSFLQFFCGVLFIISGYVKAVDPLGTAFKMEQYFAEFEAAFSGSAMKFLTPVFPWFAEQSVLFSILMIVFEIVLGVMLILGSRPKLTAWLFLLLVIFFGVLTGFTYLTGYVPQGVNFFDFSKWGPYVETNMKVTDCGCFGDFIKLKPGVSFLKDMVLFVPALLFVFASRRMHLIFSKPMRTAIVWLSLVGTTAFCWYNTYWDEPVVDFRPFFVGQDIRGRRQAEHDAESAVEILAYKLTNKQSGQLVEIPYEQYMKEFKNYPKEMWEFDQIKSEPSVPHTKVSDFEVNDLQSQNMTDAILAEPGYSLMVVSYKIPGTSVSTSVTVQDTSWIVDTVRIEGTDSLLEVRKVESVQPRLVTRGQFSFDQSFVNRFTKLMNPVIDAAMKDGLKAFCVTAYADPARVDDFRHETQSAYPFYVADDILLKTIMRSNPGLLLLKDGKIVNKWHWRHLPAYADLKANWMK
jgi:uncharacterized membrane protein YphA (DoxX/SURF4 family)